MIFPAIRSSILKTLPSSCRFTRKTLSTTTSHRSMRQVSRLHDALESLQTVVPKRRVLHNNNRLLRAKNPVWRLSDQVKHFMRAVPHALTIISSISKEEGAQRKGLLVSSFNSVTVYPIPYVSFNIKVPSSTFDAIKSSKGFTASVIDDRITAHAFAQSAREGHAEWEEMLEPDGKLREGAGGVIWMMCKWVDRKAIEIGDHAILVAEVLEAGKYAERNIEEAATVYWQGGYQSIGLGKHSARQEEKSVVRRVQVSEDADGVVRYAKDNLARAKRVMPSGASESVKVRYPRLDFDR